jgi:DMSO reductase family type II enzyme heme b subunit
MKTSMMKRNWLRLLCVLVCLSFTAGMSTSAYAAPPDRDGDGYNKKDDCNDNDPAINPGATELCTGGVDENCDSLIDCDDPTCSTDPVCACTPTGVPETLCNGVDDDCDTQVDEDYVNTPTSCGVGVCGASGQLVCQGGSETDTCSPGSPTEDPEATCDDTLDNDCDGQTDGDDFNCQSQPEICDNGLDDDNDGQTDCADHTDCNGQPGGPGGELCAQTETGFCNDGFDNDADGFTDGADTDCQKPEICSNGLDDDGDGLVDCEDHADCDGNLGGPQGQLCSGNEVGYCTDSFDNDADGFTDGTDSDCQAGAEVCDDGIDNDLDELTDCDDPDCGGVPACSAGNKLSAARVTGNVLGIAPDDGLWNATSAVTYGMSWRDDIADTCPPESNCSGQQPTLTVKAIHNGTDIAFLMSWNDVTQSSEVYQPSEFGDRAVIMLNANRICQMGSPNNPTNMWFWNAADKTQGQYGSVQNLLGGGIGTVTHTPDADGNPGGDDNIQVVSNYTGNEWQVVMSRPLAAVDAADQFEFTTGVTTEVAFALYDGKHKQRNGAKWISGRESMDIAPD